MALYAPTSIGGVYSTALWLLYSALLVGLLLALIISQRDGLANRWLCADAMLMIAIILMATTISPFPDYRWGGLLGYLLLALLFTANLRNMKAGSSLRALLGVVNCLNIALGFAIIVGISPVRVFFIQHYSQFYPELVPYMMEVGKPVLTFGTHSLAAFFFYLLFWINFETYKVTPKRTSLFFACCYIGLGFALLSVSGLVLMSIAALQIFIYAIRNRPKTAITVSMVILTSVLLTAFWFSGEVEESVADAAAIENILGSPTNGLMGRFSDLGTLRSTMAYLRARPFSPVGVGYRSDLFFGDSGVIEYYLRGSLPLVLVIYGGLFAFLKTNLISRRDAWHIFIVFFLFEMGFTSLNDFHILYFLPVLVVYLNDLRCSTAGGHENRNMRPRIPANFLLPGTC
jgi:hypothetical protein